QAGPAELAAAAGHHPVFQRDLGRSGRVAAPRRAFGPALHHRYRRPVTEGDGRRQSPRRRDRPAERGGDRRPRRRSRCGPQAQVRPCRLTARGGAGKAEPVPRSSRKAPMSNHRYDVLGIGNAIVDIIAHTDEAFLASQNVHKGAMILIDEARAEALYEAMGPAVVVSGGCAANTVAGLASFGARGAFIGKVKTDELGGRFTHDIRALGIHFPTAPAADGPATARSMILVTPDGERTMNTYLGACQNLTPADIDRETVEASGIVYLEGYLWDPPAAKEAFVKAADIAHGTGGRVAITLSDSFCVDRYRDEFLALVRDG